MAVTTIENVSITGIVSILPELMIDNFQQSSVKRQQEMKRVVASTGIKERRVVKPGQTCLDLAIPACETLLNDLHWSGKDIGLIIFVTQTPDTQLPGNAVRLQHSLGMTKATVAFDVNLGCSGFVYGLWQIALLLNGLNTSNALLIVGDTTSQQFSESNHAVAPLFGDAVSAIAIENNQACDPWVFSLGSDGAGAPYLTQPYGGAREPNRPFELFMDGTQVFVFTLREVPASVQDCLANKGWVISDIDFCIMHQANEMMLNRLAKKLGLSEQQMVIAMSHVGNTSSASIPLAICLSLSTQLVSQPNKLLMSGFGVGWSWGTVALNLPPLKVCRLLDLGDST